MNGVQRKRKEVKKIREQMTDKELFLSKAYHDSLRKFARVLGGNQAVGLVLAYTKEEDSRIALTDGNTIFLNTANIITEQFLHRKGKMASHEGLVAHECGHIRYSDFDRRTIYTNGFSQGRIFPKPPEGQTPAEKRAAEELKQFIRRRDQAAVSVIAMTAAHLNNLLEDVYIEGKMCQQYPGSVRTSIQRNTAVLLGRIPTASERKTEKNNGLDMMIDLLLRYARSGETEEEKAYDRQYRSCLEACRSRIDEAVGSDDPDIRYVVANELLLKIWKYIKKAIQTARTDLGRDFLKLSPEEQEKKAREYLKENLNPSCLSGGYDGGGGRPKTIEGWDGSLDSEETSGQEGSGQEKEGQTEKEKQEGQTEKEKQGSQIEKEKQESQTEPEGKESPGGKEEKAGNREKEESRSEKGQRNNGREENGSQKQASKDNESETGEESSQKEEKEEQGEKDEDKDGRTKVPSHIILLRVGQLAVQGQGEECGEFEGEVIGLLGQEDGAVRTGEIGGDFLEIQNKAAEEVYGKQAEVKLKKRLEDEAKDLSPEGIHKGVPVKIYRELEITPRMEAGYREIESEIKKAAGRLRQMVEEILIRKEGGVMSGLYMGKRLSRGNLYRQDGKIFEKRILPEEGFSVAFGVLVDNSGSMIVDNRIGQARKAALVLYEFCRSLSIPITVYGHSTCSVLFHGDFREGVAMYSFAEFDSVDGKDHLRIQGMKHCQCNRDGLALRFVGKHLAEREEEVKILTLISDGSPYAVNYGGETAKEDLKMAKQELHKMGVTLFSAAIGDDREVIEDIYGDSFLNISNLGTMPQKLAALLLRYLR